MTLEDLRAPANLFETAARLPQMMWTAYAMTLGVSDEVAFAIANGTMAAYLDVTADLDSALDSFVHIREVVEAMG